MGRLNINKMWDNFFYFSIDNLPAQSNWFKDYGSIIGSSITIILFIFGFIINKQLEKFKEKKRLFEVEKYLKTLIQLLEKPLLKQCHLLVEFSHILKDKKDLHLHLEDVTNFHVEEMKKIDEKDLFAIFIKYKNESLIRKTELFGKLKASIDYVNRNKQFIIIDVKEFGERFEKHQNDFKENILIIEDLFRSFFLQNDSTKNGVFFLAMNTLKTEWVNSDNNKDDNYKYTDRYNTMTKFIEPLQKLCEKHISEIMPNQIFRHIMLCTYAYDNIEEVKKIYRALFLNQARGLQKNLLQLNETIEEFESIPKEKKCFKISLK